MPEASSKSPWVITSSSPLSDRSEAPALPAGLFRVRIRRRLRTKIKARLPGPPGHFVPEATGQVRDWFKRGGQEPQDGIWRYYKQLTWLVHQTPQRGARRRPDYSDVGPWR